MKKYILSPLCSAIIVPGFGQVLNKKIVKGLVIMGLVFAIFIAVTVKLAFLVIDEVKGGDIQALNNLIEHKLLSGQFMSLWIMVAVFLLLWLYSIVDAFIDGLRIEKGAKGNPDEIVSH
jgi:hypothetical protein